MVVVTLNKEQPNFRWFIPVVCAIIGITNECKIMQVKTRQLSLCSGSQVNDNMFRPIHISVRPSSGETLVTREEFYNAYIILQCNVDVNEISLFLTNILLLLLLLQSALQPLVGFRPAQLSLITLSRKVLQSAVASGTSKPQLGGEPGI
jgi:hypothetical protein